MPEYRKMCVLFLFEKERGNKSGLDGKNEGSEDDLDTIQRSIETAAGMVAHHTKSEREKSQYVYQRMLDYVRKPRRDAQQRSRGECSRNKPGKPEQSIM